MPNVAVGSAFNEFVLLFERDGGTPVGAEIRSSPQCDEQSDDGDRVGDDAAGQCGLPCSHTDRERYHSAPHKDERGERTPNPPAAPPPNSFSRPLREKGCDY